MSCPPSLRRLPKYRRFRVIGSILVPGLIFGALSCGGGDDTPVDPGDTRSPATVTTFSAESDSASGVLLTWTATGDDSLTGKASDYDIRCSLEPDSQAVWWDSLTTAVTDTLTPKEPGEVESLLVTGLLPATLYYFGLVVLDDRGNASGLSNVDSARMLGGTDTTDTIPPATVTNLSAVSVTDSSMTLVWEAPGDDSTTGTAAEYDFRYSTDSVTTANWSGTDRVNGEPAPQSAGSSQELTVEGLSPGTAYYFAMKISDSDANWSALSNVASNTTAEEPPLPILAVDPDSLGFGSAGTESSFTIANGGDGTLTWTITDDREWISVTPTYGNTMAETDNVTVTVSRVGLSGGSYSGTVTVTPNAGNPQGVAVSMTVSGTPEVGEMTLVPAGSFTMGDGTAYCGTNQRTVTLTNSFFLGKHEVTNGEYRDALQWAYNQNPRLVTATSSTVQDNLDGSTAELVDLASSYCQISFSGGTFTVDAGKESFPMVEVSWYGAASYCDWLSLQAGLSRAYDHSTWQCNGGNPWLLSGFTTWRGTCGSGATIGTRVISGRRCRPTRRGLAPARIGCSAGARGATAATTCGAPAGTATARRTRTAAAGFGLPAVMGPAGCRRLKSRRTVQEHDRAGFPVRGVVRAPGGRSRPRAE